MRHKKVLDWQQQYLSRRPLVLSRNFKYVKLSRILLAISFIVCCHFSDGEPISTIDASSSIPGKNVKDTYYHLFIFKVIVFWNDIFCNEYQCLNDKQIIYQWFSIHLFHIMLKLLKNLEIHHLSHDPFDKCIFIPICFATDTYIRNTLIQ